MHHAFKHLGRRLQLPVWSAAIFASLALAGCSDPSPAGAKSAAAAPGYTAEQPPPVRHVFIIVLENENYDTSFGANAPAPYLAKSLPGMGALLTQYYGTGHASLDNYISMISGQAPNPATQGDCPFYVNFTGTIPPGSTDGQAVGDGCVYPSEVKTIGDQLEEAGLSWRGYAEDMTLGAPALPTSCRHPPLNSQDSSQGTNASDQYATRHVPWVYFHSITDDQPRCDAHVVDLELLKHDLADIATTPNLVFITPDVCSDGHDATCADGTSPGGYDGINAFLSSWVPRILNSPAFQQDGLLLVTFDEAEASEPSACCNEPTGPNTPEPGISGPGGGRVGAVVVSAYTLPGSTSDVPYNHYSMLRSLENLFALPYLGYAGQADLQAFGADVYNAAR